MQFLRFRAVDKSAFWSKFRALPLGRKKAEGRKPSLFFPDSVHEIQGKCLFLPPRGWRGVCRVTVSHRKGSRIYSAIEERRKEKKRSDFICIREVRMKLR